MSARLACALALIIGCGTEESSPNPASTDPEDYLTAPTSCAFECDPACEPNGYECPSLAAWSSLPHAAGCGAFNGALPTPVAGKCTASLPKGAAAKKTGIDPDDPTTTILPTGYRAKPDGRTVPFSDTNGGFSVNVLPINGSDLVVAIDSGIKDHAVRLIDTLETDPTKAIKKTVRYGASENLTHGGVLVAGATASTRRLYVGGGFGGAAKLFAFDIDVDKRELTANTAENIPIAIGGGGKGMPSGMLVRPDGKIVVTTQNNSGGSKIFLVDPATKKSAIPISLSGGDLFTAYIHPSDTTGKYVFVSVWGGARVDVVDLDGGKVVKSIPVGKAPQAFAALDDRYLALVSSDADVISIFDTLPESWARVSELKIVEASLYGWAPSGVAYSAKAKQLYVSLAGLNAVAVFDVVTSSAAPTLALKGMLSTEWWPTAVALRESDGGLVVVNGKGTGSGANPIAFKPSEGNITDLMKGSLQVIPAATIAAAKPTVDALTDLDKLEGASKVDCAGAPYDFPVPATNKEGPSKKIKKIVFAVKENKTFDAVFGDMPGVEGDPKLIMAPGQQDALFGNQRKIAKTFTNFDNYYTSAEQSLQGHVWTAFGRTTEFIERNWLLAWGRGIRPPTVGGIAPIATPVEGSLFRWLTNEKVAFDDMGEVVGQVAPTDSRYPGTVYAMDESDPRKACYIAARARITCDLKTFTYAVMPNDHTAGGAATRPTVETYIAVGDEGTGMLLAGLSRSPDWPETLVVITMDDPQDGGDHVDAHRTPLLFAGPWVKRGYVSKGHYDTSSLHKLFAHILGISYPNEIVARAALPLDAFTSTPDYTPFEHLKRTVKLACNGTGTAASTAAAMSKWDFSQPDQAPGIGRQVWEILHNGAVAPEGYGDGDDDD